MNVAVTPMTYAILLAVPIVAGVLGFALYCYHDRSQRLLETSDQLLLQLCKLHQLHYQHQILLHTIADAAELDPPGVIFVIPEEFDAAVRRAVETQQLTVREQKLLGQLRRQMFG
ncbi:hypothetical protein [Roseimaritima ulvae]|uniref:Uncharacterized protein n=1 Tax=Roseimaritima ulvae TaxID=980254 RepID=A0A5B9QTC1_9BACT|nr:hypothetical protein [Roseimaritima ulvae]QEG40326.1 hypothetical protein UC8_23350 [Roseimaritima ulvae]